MKSEIPSYLTTPTTTKVRPPVDTKLQELPYQELEWDDFERLCFRIIKTDSSIEHCQIFGKRGQNQEGIDIFARKKDNDKYNVYQCKRVKRITPASIKKIVRKFTEGDWKSKSISFALCTSQNLKSTSLIKEYETQNKKLKKLGIEFIKWDTEELNDKLKHNPLIVYDFFGVEWVKLFCGKEIAASINSKNRLSPEQVIEYRKKLGEFYRIVFNTYDPGIPSVLLGQNILPLEERFVMPDIYEKEEIYIDSKNKQEDMQRIKLSDEKRRKLFDEQQRYTRPGETFHLVDSQLDHSLQSIYEKRDSIDKWLLQNDRCIILGEQGSGKSILVRYLILDLLKESPNLSKLSDKWGCYLPVWIPFALCSKKISQDTDISIKEILRNWFKSHDREDLFKLVEQALNDERLLLLIDGLDEWSDRLSAKSALDRINIFIDNKMVPVIITSRPYGFVKLESKISNSEIVNLAPLTSDQQSKLSLIWFKAWLKRLEKDNSGGCNLDSESERICASFMDELKRTSSLNELAKIPLLLCILISQRMQNAVLPHSRFEAYEEILNNLISSHPKRRVLDASISKNPIISYFDDEKTPFSLIAYEIQNNSSEGLIEKEKAKELIRDFFIKDYGNKKDEAILKSQEILDLSENFLGILVEKSKNDLGFFHRSFQEFLTAFFLSRLDVDEQEEIICSNIANPIWREVILCFLYLIKRPSEIKNLIEKIRELVLNENELYYVNLIIYEVIFGKFDCPYRLRRQIADEAFKTIETHFWDSYKEDILNIVIEGLNSSATKNLVEEKLYVWFPKRFLWKEQIFKSFKKWEDKEGVVHCLVNNLYDEDVYNKQYAAKYLAEIASGDTSIGQILTDISLQSLDIDTRSAAFEALICGWFNNDCINKFIEINSESSINLLRFMSIKGKVRKKKNNKKDLDDLLMILSSSGFGYKWENSIIECIIEGWKKSPLLKSKCLDNLNSNLHNQKRNIPNEYKLKEILIKGYPQDSDVAKIIKDELQKEKYPFNMLSEIWPWLRNNFKGNKDLALSVEKWILEQNSFKNREIYFITPIAKKESVKNKLLGFLEDKSSFPHWTVMSLLEYWGMKDKDISKTLLDLVHKNDEFASEIGYLLPQIIIDKHKCEEKLKSLIKNPECKRLDFVIDGLINLNIIEQEDSIIDYILDNILNERNLGIFFGNVLSSLVVYFPENQKIKKLILDNIPDLSFALPSISYSYNYIPEVRKEIISYCTPLPEPLRNNISKQVGKSSFDSEFTIETLGKYRYEMNPDIKIQTAVNYYENIVRYGVDHENEEKRLSEELIKTGPDYSETRQAAFCGAVILKRPDLIKQCMNNKVQQKYSIALEHQFLEKPSFIRFMLSYWKYIYNNFGENIWSILQLHSDHVWNTLSNFIEEYPDAKRELIKYIENSGVRKYEVALLNFISNNFPKSKFLLDCCLKVLLPQKNQYGFLYESYHSAEAGYIVGNQFKGDKEVLDVLNSKILDKHSNGYIIALCKGWNDSKELDEIYETVKEKQIELSIMSAVFLICSKATPNRIISKICELIEKNIGFSNKLIIGEIIKRIQNDKILEELLLKRLYKTTSVNEKVTFLNIIRRTPIINSQLDDWSLNEIKTQRKMKCPEIGYDFAEDKYKSVIVSILNSLKRNRF